MDLLEGIYTRRSVRDFTVEPVGIESLREIIRAGAWAPSGMNNQPWRFVIITDPAVREGLSRLTKYSRIILSAPACIAVFIDKEAMYHEVKDYQAMGACMQNMLLAAHAMGLGAVWLGEILKSAGDVRALCGVTDSHEFMSVIAIGRPKPANRASDRRPLNEVILKEI